MSAGDLQYEFSKKFPWLFSTFLVFTTDQLLSSYVKIAGREK
jgi:hypothetical protein